MTLKTIKNTDGKKTLVERDIGMRHDYFECICDSDEHLLRFTYFVDEWNNIKEEDVFLSVHLSSCGFWWRLKNAIRYVFGYDCRYGHFESTTFRRSDAERLRDLMDRYINSGMEEADDSRKIKIVEKGDNYVITDKGVKVWLLADEDDFDYDKQEKPND